MSACARCRWGPGTTKDRTPNTESAKQLESSLQTLLAARSAQDSYFVTESSVIPMTTTPPQSSDINKPTYAPDKSLQILGESAPHMTVRSQLTSSMNFGAPSTTWDWPLK